MKQILKIAIITLLLTSRSEAQPLLPSNYWSLSPDQQIEALLNGGGGEYELDKIGKKPHCRYCISH